MKAVKRALDAIITNDVQDQLSLTGYRTKKPGMVTNYKKIIDAIHVAMSEKYAGYTQADGEEKIGTLLQS